MRRVGLFALGDQAAAAAAMLESIPQIVPRRLDPGRWVEALPSLDLLWVHAEGEPPPLSPEAVLPWVARGGRVLLTQRAASCVVALGLERDGPNDTTVRRWRNEDDELAFPDLHHLGGVPRMRGLAGFGPHPLFEGMGQGTYVWAPAENELYAQATYARGRRPLHGRVVACERSYIHVNADRAVAWEYAVDRGGVLCIGAFVVPGARDPLLARQLGALLGNALRGNAIPHAEREQPAAAWPPPGRVARPDENLVFPDRVPLDGPLPGLQSALHESGRALVDAPVTIAGRRVFVAAREQRGIQEVWVHPYRVLRDFSVSIGGEAPLVRDVQVTPSMVQRHLVSRARIVEEAVMAALDHPLVVLDYRPEKVGRARGLRAPADLTLRWRVDLRRNWPYPTGAGGDLRYRLAPDGGMLVVTDATGWPRAAFVPGGPAEWRVRPDPEGPVLRCELRVSLEAPFRLALIGGVTRADQETAVAALGRRGVGGLTAQRQRHETQVQEHLVRVRTPDETVNRAFAWAKARLDGFLVEVPGIGRSLVAGYAASSPGWGDGRPGYAWFFGRDACWTSLALLAAGDYASCRLVLRFLGASQDVSGKVMHEVTTSGLAHYDAADATPLYLLLAGRYAAWTGDLAFLRERWTDVERAYRFCLETDRDGDGLIENTRVGHGWVEGGPLSGARVSLYLAGIWVAALEGLEPVARGLGDGALADELAARAARARSAIAERFLTSQGYAFGLRPDGTAQLHETALTAVPLWLRAIDRAPAAAWLDAIAGPEFSAPWGVRLISRQDPLYSPAGYHRGAVWPLFTGWVSLAEYACHRETAAHTHLVANARLPGRDGIGCFPEVLDGDLGTPAGVCADQAWSAAMVVLPLIEGLLGARPDALANRLTLVPHLPVSWSDAEWRGLHVGHTTLDVRVSAAPDRVMFRLRRTAGGPLQVVVDPAIPSGSAIADTRVDDEELAARETVRLGCRHGAVTLELTDEHEVEMLYRRAPATGSRSPSRKD